MAYMPSPASLQQLNEISNEGLYSGFEDGNESSVTLTAREGQERVLMYIVVGIVSFIVLCMILVLIIGKKNFNSNQERIINFKFLFQF